MARPSVLTVLGVLGIGLGLLAIGRVLLWFPAFTTLAGKAGFRGILPALLALRLGSAAVAILFGVAEIVCGLGLLKMREWRRAASGRSRKRMPGACSTMM